MGDKVVIRSNKADQARQGDQLPNLGEHPGSRCLEGEDPQPSRAGNRVFQGLRDRKQCVSSSAWCAIADGPIVKAPSPNRWIASPWINWWGYRGYLSVPIICGELATWRGRRLLRPCRRGL